MYKFAIAFMTLFLAGCCCDPSYVPSYRRDNGAADAPVYRKTARRGAYTKYVAPKGDVIHAAGFDIQQGQQMRDFFDDFEEPMHARYVGNNTVRWTYYVDYEPDDGKIVRYCELGDYQPHSLCTLTVEFYRTYVSNAYSDCGGAPAMTAYNGYVY